MRSREQVIPRLRGAGNKGSTPKRRSHTPHRRNQRISPGSTNMVCTHMLKIYIMYLWTAYPPPKREMGVTTLLLYPYWAPPSFVYATPREGVKEEWCPGWPPYYIRDVHLWDKG
jgi:hypothetical protein